MFRIAARIFAGGMGAGFGAKGVLFMITGREPAFVLGFMAVSALFLIAHGVHGERK